MAVKKILCSDPNCDGVIAHQLADKTVELKRLDQKVTATGDNWSTIATCPKNPAHKTSIVATNGLIDATDIRYKEEAGDENHDDDDKKED